MFEEFTLDSYRRLLTKLAGEHTSVRFADFPIPDSEAYFILRHDIDYSPAAALEMGKLEHNLGIRSTYFVLFSSPYYNLLSSENIGFPQKLVEMGHEVGLHYDVAAYCKFGCGDMHQALLAESRVLSEILGNPVKSIAMHNPSISGEDPFRGIEGLTNAYASAHARDIEYFSDSCAAWRDGAVRALSGTMLPRKFQLLIHPILWTEMGSDRWEKLDNFAGRQVALIQRNIAQTKDMWAKHAGVIQHDARLSKR